MDSASPLKAFLIGIDTHQEPIIYMRDDCDVCRSEGLSAHSRVGVKANRQSVIATLNVVHGDTVPEGYAGLSNIAMDRLGVSSGDPVSVHHAPVTESLSLVRRKVFGHELSQEDLARIVSDISEHKYSDLEIACFLSVCAGGRLTLNEIIGLTRAMVGCGERLHWEGATRVFDKHCVGGLPGNRTTPLVVAIVSAAGLVMPKTSSRAITSPAGTADTMETLTTVTLSLADLQRVVTNTGACLAWGGAINLSPADDLLIRIERALDLDGEGQLVASVLSKKIAAGSTHVVIDIPVGVTAKVRSQEEAERLSFLFSEVGADCGLTVRSVFTDGSRPVGSGIGPVEEARDVMAVLQGRPKSPGDLKERAVLLAAHVFDMADSCGIEEGKQKARHILESGRAWEQFRRITQEQGGLKQLGSARFRYREHATESGKILTIDNRRLARLAKLAGAPESPAAGLRLFANVGDTVAMGDPLFELLSESTGERDYALTYIADEAPIFTLQAES